MLSEHLPNYITNAKKSGPNLPIKFWFDTRPELKKKTYEFIKKNNLILEKFVSKEFAKNIMNESIFRYDQNFEITFKILCFIIWIKLNIDKSIINKKITFEDLVNS